MWRNEDCYSGAESYDPLSLARGRPMDDAEAERIESICQAATAGPLVTDEASEGGGALIATLPDGRNVVSTHPPESCPEAAERAAQANAQLIREGRCMVVRLLRDRRWRKHREEILLERIRELEARLEDLSEAAASDDSMAGRAVSLNPR